MLHQHVGNGLFGLSHLLVKQRQLVVEMVLNRVGLTTTLEPIAHWLAHWVKSSRGRTRACIWPIAAEGGVQAGGGWVRQNSAMRAASRRSVLVRRHWLSA